MVVLLHIHEKKFDVVFKLMYNGSLLKEGEIMQKFKHILIVLLGSCILAFGMYNIHDQAKITEGGVLGLILLFQAWLHISPSIIGPVLDGLCYLIGWKVLGNRFLKNAILASCGFSVFYAIFERIGPVFGSFIHIPIVASLLGACFVGVGVGLVVKEGGACGGDDAIALTFSKLLKCRISQVYFVTDLTVLLLSLTYIPFINIFYSLISVMLSSYIIEKIQQI